MDDYEREQKERDLERMRERLKAAGRAKAFIVLGILSFAGIAAFHVAYVTGPEYQYNRTIGAYLSNAYDASTFDVMRDQLLLAIQAMHNAGLTPDLYGRALPWEQTRDYGMAYQYVYLDGLVNRSEYYIRIFAANNTQPFQDVYTRAIENMRAEFGRNGPVDWVAQPAWMLKYNGIYYWGPAVWALLSFLGVNFIIAGIAYYLRVS